MLDNLPLQSQSSVTNPQKILTQNSPKLTKKTIHWLVVLSSIPLFGFVTAFGIAPNVPALENIQTEDVVLDLSIPNAIHEAPENQIFWHQENIRRGDTISAILNRLDISNQDSSDFLQAVRGSRAMRQLQPGKTIYAQTSSDGELLGLRYSFNNEELFLMEKTDDEFKITEQSIELDTRVHMRAGVISSSLFAAVDSAGIPNNIATQLTEIFASQIDFHRDLRHGDRFIVVYETLARNEVKKHAKTARVLAVEFTNKGKVHQAVYFKHPNGRDGYYTPKGESLRKEFLLSPLTVSRISSGFSNGRFHPILKEWRAHKGIDYAAPAGTPVKATASGIVGFSGSQRGYGNLVVLKHNGKFETAYGHLSRFAPGVSKGKRVNQGDTIGYVGSTGMATGPHLHYELRIDGVQRDPTRIALPTATPLGKKELIAFQKETQPFLSRLNIMRNIIHYAASE
ncbi:murein DD-endopeptidase MepM and murein hydrolase activator NlpD, contain LysM domain [Nitrosomonas sp. PY1]|uniref:M23 family metallopeptidase n=1 Tax=Nitrosomonas sp. PY1 TaxID=1803906 RepID=UPI001FC8BE15|nr:peptidoglycan DD-metalloendopeptidase family protein [Nitrosomonas sp. PY1]GKS68103.1 murein DD-endopeptidase MepM and murein hydrolase activator NlpD, contain LysM domain [Nitrosomonas sp. PY1]